MGHHCTCARAHRVLYLRNGSVDCAQICCVGLGSLSKCFEQVIGGGAFARAHVRTPFPQMLHLLPLGNGWDDCAEIWYAIGVSLVVVYAVITGGVSLHVRTCTPRFCISGTGTVFKFGVCVCVCVCVCVGGSLPKCFPRVMGGVHPHMRTFSSVQFSSMYFGNIKRSN